MAWDTPWFVGGANHEADVARLITFAAFHAQEGVLGAFDCVCSELDVPGPAVRVAPGVTNIFARGLGSVRQSYANALETEDVVAIAPTDASGPRSDLIIVRVEDPNIPGSGWNPADPTTGPFQFTRVIPGVPATTNNVQQVRPGDSAITIARIDIPGGPGQETGTITNDMITDLRSIADLEGERLVIINNPAPPIASSSFFDMQNLLEGDEFLLESHTTFQNFPEEANWLVPVPSWAQSADVSVDIIQAKQDLGPIWGEARVKLSDDSDGNVTYTDVLVFDNDYYGGGSAQAVTITAGGHIKVSSGLRGKMAHFRFQCRQYVDPATTGRINANGGVAARINVNFKRSPSAYGIF